MLPASLANWHLAHASLDAGDAATAAGLLDLSVWRPQPSAPQRGRPGYLTHTPDACLLRTLCLLGSSEHSSDEKAADQGGQSHGSGNRGGAAGLDNMVAAVKSGGRVALQICMAKALCGQSAGNALDSLTQLRALEIVKQGNAAPLLPGKGSLDSLLLAPGQTIVPGSLPIMARHYCCAECSISV